MTREQATRLLQAFYRKHGLPPFILNENKMSGIMLQTAQLYFEYEAGEGTLVCRALIYKFQKEPHPQVLEKFKEEEKAGSALTGGGRLEYMPENRGLYLSRTYAEETLLDEFDDDVQRLAHSSIVWTNEVAARMAAQVFHPNEINHQF